MSIDDLRDLEKEVTDLKRDSARAEGALDEIKKALLKDFGCSSIKEAEKKAKTLKAELAQLKEQYEKALQEYRRARADSSAEADE